MFVDGGGFLTNDHNPTYIRNLFFSSWLGPTWSDAAGTFSGSLSIPKNRHSATGGLVGVHVDGHATYFQPVKWGAGTPMGRRTTFTEFAAQRAEELNLPTLYSPNPRITPYDP